MRVSLRDNLLPCRNCGRDYPADRLDRMMWCAECRRLVIRRATWVGRALGLGIAAILAAWIFLTVGTAPRFLVIWLVLIGATYFFIFKLTQRVAFEVIRARGLPPPPSEDG